MTAFADAAAHVVVGEGQSDGINGGACRLHGDQAVFSIPLEGPGAILGGHGGNVAVEVVLRGGEPGDGVALVEVVGGVVGAGLGERFSSARGGCRWWRCRGWRRSSRCG